MRQPRIHTPQDLTPGALIHLEEQASHHLCQVLRMRAGQSLILFNGRGGEYHGQIHKADRRACEIRLESFDPIERESPLQIHLGLALSKGDRFDWALQKATELGVSEITPLITARTEVRLKGDRLEKKHNHWQRLIESACEQSFRTRLPLLHPCLDYADWLQQCSGVGFILHPGLSESDWTSTTNPGRLSLTIGPEGGFDEQEIQQARLAGLQGLSLGPRILRTETAPLVAIGILQWRWGDFRPLDQ